MEVDTLVVSLLNIDFAIFAGRFATIPLLAWDFGHLNIHMHTHTHMYMYMYMYISFVTLPQTRGMREQWWWGSFYGSPKSRSWSRSRMLQAMLGPTAWSQKRAKKPTVVNTAAEHSHSNSGGKLDLAHDSATTSSIDASKTNWIHRALAGWITWR